MDLPAHVATGAVIGNLVWYLDDHFRTQTSTPRDEVKVWIASFLWGVLSHLFFDAIPHYDWLFKLGWLKPLPYWWMIPQVAATAPILWAIWHCNRDHRLLAVVSVTGGIWPDIEKLLYFDFNLPRTFVMFRQHSCALTPWTPWEMSHKGLLIGIEVGIIVTCLAGIYGFYRNRNARGRVLRWQPANTPAA